MTKYISEAELTASLTKVLDEVKLDGSVIVTRPNGERVLFQRLPAPAGRGKEHDLAER